MSNSNVFFINMKKNIGKRILIGDIVEKLNAIIWNGVDKSIYNENGILLDTLEHVNRSRAAKEAKLNMFDYFLKNSQSDYLVLFEDDIIIHKDFYEHYKTVIDFANNNEFKLIYMGVSCRVPNVSSSDNLSISPLPKTNYRYSGAYGVIIHRSVINSLIRHSNDPFLYNKPFDISALGHVQLCYPKECFICSPQLVIPNITISDIREPRAQNIFWDLCHVDKTQYVIPKYFPMYILTDDNLQKIKQFISILSMFVPYIKPIFVCLRDNKILETTYRNTYDIIYINDFSNISVNNIIVHSEYALTNIYVNWTKNINNIFDGNDNVFYDISTCPHCTSNKFISEKNNMIFNGMSIIHNNSQIKKMHNDNLFYVYDCQVSDTGKMHVIK